MKQNVLLVGLIADFGGREIEVRNIIVALSKQYTIRVVSLLHMTNESVAVKDLNCSATTIFKALYSTNFLLRCFSFLSKMYNGSKLPTYFFIENAISKKLFSISNKKATILEKEIDQSNIVLYCGVLESHLLSKIIHYCDAKNKPIILRTTGKITKIDKAMAVLLPKVSSILVHSKNNANVLTHYTQHNIDIIDQTTLLEKELLSISIPKKEGVTFGYLGRFSSEKGIVELLKIAKKYRLDILVAGVGDLEHTVYDLLDEKDNFLGEVKPVDVTDFFKKIDILIIPSHEEAGPLVGIEAMAAGKLLFSTRVGAMEERLGKTANDFWFTITNEATFLELLEKLKNTSPDTLKEIREKNRVAYLEKYSMESISKQYVQLFETILQKNNS